MPARAVNDKKRAKKMTMMRDKYLNSWLADIAEEVAAKWKVCAPFPTKRVLNKYDKWVSYTKEIDQLKRIAANPHCKRPKSTHNKLAAAVRKRDRMIVPRRYLSWAHIAAFREALAKRVEDATLDERRIGSN